MNRNLFSSNSPSPNNVDGQLLFTRQWMITSVCISAFLTALFILFYFYIWSRQERWNQRETIPTTRSSSMWSGADKLKPEVLASLPVFVYGASSQEERLECAICLTEFKDGEKGRLLPRCCHKFHTECVDMWFDSHSSCPLCRVTVEVEGV